MKPSTRTLLGAAALCLFAGSVQAQETRFAGNTTGCFYTTVVCVPAGLSTLGGLTYTSLDPSAGFQFDDISDPDGYLPVGGASQNFGVFTLSSAAFDYTDWNFLLNVMFTAPPGVTAVNVATLQGKVVNNGNGLTVNFDTAPIKLEATDGTLFDLTVHQTSLTRRNPSESVTAYVNGELQVTATPEPATVGLMMLGIAGLVPVALRRRRQARAET